MQHVVDKISKKKRTKLLEGESKKITTAKLTTRLEELPVSDTHTEEQCLCSHTRYTPCPASLFPPSSHLLATGVISGAA